jgi:hypothetical protein
MHQPYSADERRSVGCPPAGGDAPAPSLPAAVPGTHVYASSLSLLKPSLLWATLAALLSGATAFFWLSGRISALEVMFAEHVEVARQEDERRQQHEKTPPSAPRPNDVRPAERILLDTQALTPPVKPFTPKVSAAARPGVPRRSGDTSRQKNRRGAGLGLPPAGMR